MRKFLLSAVALLMSICMLAGDGSSKANAIDFDWANGHKPALSAGSWYRVDLSHMKNEANDPTLALYLTNLTDQTASVSLTLEASLLGQSMSQKSSYNIAGKDYQLWSRQSFDYNGRTMSLKQLMSAGLSEVYLQLTSSKEIALSAKVYETEEIVDDACTKAKDFNWSGVDVMAGEQWFRLNLSEVKKTDNLLKLIVTNNGTNEAKVSFDMSLDCPASAVIEKDWVIPAGSDMEDEFGRVFLDVLKEDYVYLKLTNDQPLTLRVEEEVVIIPPGKYDDFDCATAPELVFDTDLALTAGQHIYKVKRDNLLGGRGFASEFIVTNNGATPATLTVETAFTCPVKSSIDQTVVIDGNTTVVKAIKDNVLKAFDVEWVYIRFITDQDLTATVGKRNTDPCINAVPFDWTVGASLAAGESQWYEVNIALLKQDKKHLTLAFTNHSDNIALVNVEVALDCNGTILPITLPIYRGLSVAQTIDYNLLKHVPLDRIYVGVSTDSHIEMAASVKDAIAADPSPCLNAINPVHGVEYTHEANTTNWYKISLDLLESTTDYSSIYLANKGNQRAHVTIGVVTDCQYTPSSRITLPMPSNFDLGMLAPNVLGKLLKELARIERVYNKVDSKDIYLEIQSDQPIGFGLDVVNPITSPCLRSDLITFDWNKGAKVEKGNGMKWFDMDLDAVKASGKHVKLTLTNHTDSLVWAATMVSVECPAKLTMPLLVPVPAGMSIDHVINYQLFAVADLHNIYIGVLTDGALELKAESIDAIILPPADCLSAQKIVSGQEYVQNAGTQWYQFPMSLIDEMGGAAKISFKNLTCNHATLSAGVTVGCEYPAHTVAKAIAPKSLDFSVNLPKAIIAKVRGLIDPAITDFYVQLTTDQKIAFTLNNHATDVRACASATAFDWNSWKTGGLQLAANQENWYKVNLGYPLQQLRNGEDITIALANSNPMDVEVELAVSPTCPIVLSLEKSLTIPAGVSASATLSYDKLVNFVAQYDKFNLLDRDYAKLMEQINAYALYNKLNQLLEEYGYDDNVPLYRIEPLIDRYGQAASLANLKQLLENPRKYISVAEIKQHLQQIKDRIQDEAEARLTLDNLLDAFDKYGDKIPYVDAEQLINNADLLLPYIGSAQIILDKCKQYISKDDFRTIVDRCKQLVPFEELNQLFNRVEDYIKQRLPEPNTIYLYVKSTGDLVIAPEIPAAPKCEGVVDTISAVACDAFVWKGEKYTESGIYRDTISASNIADAELLNWKQVIKLSEFSKPWYKLDVKEILDNKLDFTLSLNNDLDTSLNYSLELYTCDMEFMASQSATVDGGIISRTITYKEFEELMDGVECEELYLRNVNYDCDRIEELHLTINKSVATEFAAEACELYEWNGQVYTASGDYVDTLTTIHGCDSIVTLHLTINKSVATEFAAEACELYEWNGQAYTVSGDYVDTLTTINGCDSIVTLHLTINNSVATEFAAEACDSYTWNGQVYTVSGDYVDTLTTINGCDSIVTMHLTINTPVYTDVHETICYGEGYEWAGEWKYDAGTYADTLAAINGCDSIVTLHLTILPEVATVFDTMKICLGESYTWNGQTYTATGDYTETLYNSNGCAYDAYLHLVVEDCSVIPPTPQDSCENAELVQWDDVIVVPANADKWYKVDYRTALASGKDIEVTLKNGADNNNVEVKFSTECFDPNAAVPGNPYGWKNKNDMFQALMADCGITTLPSLDELKALGANGFTKICSSFVTAECQAFLDNPQWDWLEAYIMLVQNADVTTPATQLTEGVASAGWRYAVAAFFLESQRTSWPRSADFSVAGKDAAYLPAWGYTYAAAQPSVSGITVKAKVPASWTDQIYVWVWPTGGAGHEEIATKDGDWWTYTHQGADVNILFKDGTGWKGLEYQTVDMSFTENACVEIEPSVWGDKATYTTVECENNVAGGATYNTFATSFAPYEIQKHTLTQADMAQLGIVDYVYAHVTTTGEFTVQAETVDTPPCVDETKEYWVTQCDPYEWYGQLYDQTADYTRTSTTPEGCTLTEILHLTIDCPPTPQDPCLTAELVQWDEVIVVPANADKWYKVDYTTAVASGKDVELTLENGADNNNVEVKFSTECFTLVNPYGWKNKNDMFQALMADCGITTLPSLDELKALGANGLTKICSSFVTAECQAFLDNPQWDWLEAYIMQVQNADVTTPATQLTEGVASAGWRYAVAAFFLENQRTSWPRSADFSVTGQDAAYLPAWGYTYAAQPSVSGITVKAKVPANWTDQIYVWVWPDGGAGTEYIAEKDGDSWTYTHQDDYVNIIFKNGQGWAGSEYQTVDMRFTENTCVVLDNSLGMATYTTVECENNVAAGATYNTFATSFAPYEIQKHTLTQADMAQLGIVDYVYAHVTTTGEFTVTADTIDTPPTPGCVDVYTEFSAQFCGSYTWNGVTYTVAGDHVQTFHLPTGCDSIVTLHLTEYCAPTPCTPVYTEFDAVFCGSYTWNGEVYTVAGDHVQTLKKVDGCDSIVTMHLTEDCPVIPTCKDVYTEFTTTFCGSFTWNKQVYTTAGDYVQTLTKTDGCDSIVTLHLIEDCPVVPPTPELPGNPCLDAIPFDWTTGAFLAADSCEWYEMDITSLKENKQHLTLTFTNHSAYTAWVHMVLAMDCEGTMVPMLLPVPAGLSIDETIDYQLLSRSPLNRIYIGVCTNADIELKSSVETAIATDPSPCLNATNVEYNVTYSHASGTSWYKVSTDLLKNTSDAVSFQFTNKGNKRAHVTIGVVGDCQYTTGTTITLPIPTGIDFGILVPNILGKMIEEVASFEKALNNVDIQEVYVEMTTDEPVEFILKTYDNNQACTSAIDLDWAEWESNGLQLQANQDTWYKLEMDYVLNKMLRGDSISIILANPSTEMNVDVDMSMSPTCPVFVALDKSFTVPAGVTVKKTLSYVDAIEWLAQYEKYIPTSQIKAFIDKYEDKITVSGLKDKLASYEQYVSIDQLKAELAKYKEYIPYAEISAALDKLGDYVPVDQVETALKQYEPYIKLYAGGMVALMKKCEPYITVDNLKDLIAYCEERVPYATIKDMLKFMEGYLKLADNCYLRVKTTGDLIVTPDVPALPDCSDDIVETTVSACDTYTWHINGETYNVSGDYTDTIKTAKIEDAGMLDWSAPIKLSEFTAPWYKLDVTEIIANKSDFTLVIENDYDVDREVTLNLHDGKGEFMNGITRIVVPGLYTRTLTYAEFEEYIGLDYDTIYLHNASADCDQVQVLHLTINKSVATETSAVSCDSYTWNGQVYTASGDYVDTLTTIHGCDSIVTLHLTINKSVATEFAAEACESYEWNGQVYTASGDYVDTLTTIHGCDSIVTLHLTINKSVATEFTAEACESYTWNGQVYTASGDYVDTLTTINGCDSIVTMHLTINTPMYKDVYATICYGEGYEWAGEWKYDAGTYADTLTTVNGCDSIVTLHLTIENCPSVVDVYDTIAAYVCDGTEYISPYTGEKHIISSLVPATLTWEDVVVATDTIFHHAFVITPIVAPTLLTDATLATISGATPVLTQGLLPDVTGTAAAIKAYYAANDAENIADVTDVYWDAASLTTKVVCGALTHTMTLVVETECDNVLTTTHTFDVPVLGAGIEEYITICAGDTYTWNGTPYTATGTYQVMLVGATGCDSLATLNLTVLPAIPETVEEATICAGETYTWNGKTYNSTTTESITLTSVNGCDSVVTLKLVVLPAIPETVEEATICAGETYTWNGKTYNSTTTESITLTSVNGCDSVVTLKLVVLPAIPETVEEATICAGETYTWNGKTYNSTTTESITLTSVNGCDSVVTLKLVVLPAIPETVEEATICAGETYTWNGKTYNSTTTESITLTSVNGCDSVVTLKLVVLPAIPETVEEATICAGETYTWNGKTYNSTTTESITLTSVNGCDSVVTLKLTVLPEATTEYEDMIVCEGDLPIVWRGQVCATVGTYTVVDTYANTGCDSVIHILNLQTYVLTAPAYVTTPVAVCGNPVDVTAATADIKAHIASESNYAPNATVTWYIQKNGTWAALTDQLLKGTDEAVTLKYVIASDCGEVSDTFDAIPVEMPTPANDVDMDNIPVVSKYDNRVLLLHLNAILATHGWTPEPEEVKWYRVVNELDTYGQPGDDEFTGITGHYFNYADASVMDGQYYALIVHTTEGNAEECDTYMRTEVITCTINKVTPRLLSNVVRPDENLTLINLNPEMITEIRVYSTTGELMATYTADQVEEFIFKAAHISGYYMVDVETEDNKVTLRYVVK